MEKEDKNYKIIDEAYKEYQKFAQKYPERVEGSKACIDGFYKDISNWDGKSRLNYIINKYLVGELADCVASPGQGNGNKEEFIRFMNDEDTLDIIIKLVEIRRVNEGKMNYKLIKMIQDAGILQHLNRWIPLDKKKKPIILVERFLCIMFDELFTSTANHDEVFDIAKELEIVSHDIKKADRPYHLYFEQMQSDIKYSIDNYFRTKGENVDNYIRFSIAWFIVNKVK